MRITSISRKFAGALAALALCTASTGAIAASSHQASSAGVSPLVALSALGSDASRAALCGASAVAAAGATAVAQGAAQGCVLPVMDPAVAAPPPLVETLPPPPVPPPPVAPVGGGFGISPLLLALAGIAAAVLLVVLLKDKDKDEDVSPA